MDKILFWMFLPNFYKKAVVYDLFLIKRCMADDYILKNAVLMNTIKI